jgi:hypothetical protein
VCCQAVTLIPPRRAEAARHGSYLQKANAAALQAEDTLVLMPCTQKQKAGSFPCYIAEPQRQGVKGGSVGMNYFPPLSASLLSDTKPIRLQTKHDLQKYNKCHCSSGQKSATSPLTFSATPQLQYTQKEASLQPRLANLYIYLQKPAAFHSK